MCGRELAPLTLQCPACGEEIAEADKSVRSVPAWPRIGPVVPRYVAASIDNGIAMVLSVLAAKTVEGDVPLIQVPLLVGVYVGYFVVFEGALARTPGKFVAGLSVAQYDGSRCTWRQAVIRNAWRLLEVNPFLCGALPAAICIVRSADRQRFGDTWAKTLVISTRRRRG